jgi:L-asparaginase/Glu-tRNA(Gln) amidotransferase subunit D
MQKSNLKKTPFQVEIIYAGGTISSLMTDKGYREGGHKIDLVSLLKDHTSTKVQDIVTSKPYFAYLGLSENINYSLLSKIEKKVRLALGKPSSATIITYGTDSMEHAARYLQYALGAELKKTRKVVILTGSNRDASASNTDAWENLQFALQCSTKKMAPGVYVAFHNLLIPADSVVKEPFDGKEMNYIPSSSSKYRQLLKEKADRDKYLLKKLETRPEVPVSNAVIDYPVNRIVANHTELFQKVSPTSKAVLLTLYHSGTANTQDRIASVAKLVRFLRKEKGLVFFAVSENGEPIDLHLYSTSVELREAGVVPLHNMSKSVALRKLQLLASLPAPEMISEMLTNWFGEIEIPDDELDIQDLLALYS